MAHGGKRAGAGKPKGATHKRNKEIAEKAVAGRMTPLEVMLENMYYAQAQGDRAEAQMCAKDAAPYVHAKLQATTISGDPNKPINQTITPLTAKELLALNARSESEY